MEYSQDTQNHASRYNLTPREVMFCHALAGGADLADAFFIINNNGKVSGQRAAIEAQARDYMKGHPAVTLLVRTLKRGRRNTQKEAEEVEKMRREEARGEREREKDLSTRNGIIDRAKGLIDGLQGKEQLQALQLLAKMQGLDKPEEAEEEEKRTYFLPWVSNCRACELMKLLQEIHKKG